MRSSWLLATCLLFAPTAAFAFDSASQFFAPAGVPSVASTSASAEGIFFTGAPRFSGQTCSACHIDAPGSVNLRIGSNPATLFTDGYLPGMSYEIELELVNETRGMEYGTPTCTEPLGPKDTYTYVQCNNNNFALEIDSGAGPLHGGTTFCASSPVGGTCPTPIPSSDEVVVSPAGDAVFGNQAHSTIAGMEKVLTQNGQTRWRFWWTAPGTGAGPLTLYVGAVDGNGESGISTDDQGPYGDDTVAASVSIREAGDGARLDAQAGCALARPSASVARDGVTAFVALAVGAVIWRNRRRLRRSGARKDVTLLGS